MNSKVFPSLQLQIQSFCCPILPVRRGFPGGSDGKESTYSAGDLDLIPELGRSPEGGHGYPL